jgi:hypothetical protein
MVLVMEIHCEGWRHAGVVSDWVCVRCVNYGASWCCCVAQQSEQ